jgi:predicted membrane-bound spermidine synthase
LSSARRVPLPFVYSLFLCSGFAALVYQVVWQRSLFAIFGVNVEAVTVVVTAFMLGLGLGSLAGGALSADPRRPGLVYFGIIEIGIGTFGCFSLELFRAVGERTAGAGGFETFFVAFVLVLAPTVLMGSTLPLLVAHVVRASGNVGRSVGMLYFVNTMGSAIAAFATATYLLGRLGQTNTVRLAAAINAVVGGSVLLFSLATHRSTEARP